MSENPVNATTELQPSITQLRGREKMTMASDNLLRLHRELVNKSQIDVPETIRQDEEFKIHLFNDYVTNRKTAMQTHELMGTPFDQRTVNATALLTAIRSASATTLREKAEREAIRTAKETDAKVNLPNALAFTREAQLEMGKVNGDPRRFGAGMALLDIKDFGLINDRVSEEVADESLKNVAYGLKESFRPYDTISRFGGDEFAALMRFEKTLPEDAPDYPLNKQTDLIEGEHPTERARKLIPEVREFQGPPVVVSFGYSDFIPGEPYNEWFARTSTALKVAKLLGKNRTVIALTGMDNEGIFYDITDKNNIEYKVTINGSGFIESITNVTHGMIAFVHRPEGEKKASLGSWEQFPNVPHSPNENK